MVKMQSVCRLKHHQFYRNPRVVLSIPTHRLPPCETVWVFRFTAAAIPRKFRTPKQRPPDTRPVASAASIQGSPLNLRRNPAYGCGEREFDRTSLRFSLLNQCTIDSHAAHGQRGNIETYCSLLDISGVLRTPKSAITINFRHA